MTASLVRRKIVFIALASILVLVVVNISGCGGDSSSNGSAAPSLEPMEPFAASLSADTPTVAVERLIRDSKSYQGRIAVQGVVVQVVADRGAIMLVDEEEFKSCGLKGCTDSMVPVRITHGDFRGVLPKPGDLVIVVGDFEPLERGFSFNLNEVHREGMVILSRKP